MLIVSTEKFYELFSSANAAPIVRWKGKGSSLCSS